MLTQNTGIHASVLLKEWQRQVRPPPLYLNPVRMHCCRGLILESRICLTLEWCGDLCVSGLLGSGCPSVCLLAPLPDGSFEIFAPNTMHIIYVREVLVALILLMRKISNSIQITPPGKAASKGVGICPLPKPLQPPTPPKGIGICPVQKPLLLPHPKKESGFVPC